MSPAAPWLHVVGVGDDGPASLTPGARALVQAGEVLVGGRRHLEMFPDHPGERLCWRSPLEATLAALEARRGRRVVVLASGDPMHFGIGEWLHRCFAADEIRVLPAPSAFGLVCARLGWARSGVETLSLHDRPPEALYRHLAPGARLVLLSHDGGTAAVVARMLADRGFGPSRLWVFEHLGGQKERRLEGTAGEWQEGVSAALNTVAIECRAGPGARIDPPCPGLPDDAFETDGMLTKREVRAATLARLAPLAGQRLWDVGAGSGAVAIEWLRAAPRAEAVAVERDPARCARITSNARALGTPELQIVQGTAPDALEGLPRPDAVFIGGGIAVPGLLELCWERLRPGGRLVANVVTIEGERILYDWHERHSGELLRIAIARTGPIGPRLGWRASIPVTQLALGKP